MASYHHQAFFQSSVDAEYFDEGRNDKVITKIKVFFDTTNLDTGQRTRSTYYVDIPPPGDVFTPYNQVDYHVFRKWAAMYGDAIYYQNVNVEKLNDTVEAEKNCNIPDSKDRNLHSL